MSALYEINSYLEAVRDILEHELSILTEEGYRNPYRYTSSTTPGPRGHPPKKKRNAWDCDCGYYFCNCVGIAKSNKGQKKRVNRDKAYVKQYNKDYDDTKYPLWRNKRRQRAKRGTGGSSD